MGTDPREVIPESLTIRSDRDEPHFSSCPSLEAYVLPATTRTIPGGGGVLPYKGLMGTCGQPGYVFRDFCLKQCIEFIIFCLHQGIDLSIFVLNRINVLNRV